MEPVITIRAYKYPYFKILALLLLFVLIVMIVASTKSPDNEAIFYFSAPFAVFFVGVSLFSLSARVELYHDRLVYKNLVLRREIKLETVSEIFYNYSFSGNTLGTMLFPYSIPNYERTLCILHKVPNYGYREFVIYINLCSKQDITSFLKNIHLYKRSIKFDGVSSEMMNGDFTQAQW
ncbi:MAG: hypothetical protein J2P49_00455 [Methylocapsa sp.]|nr:hypothetical protein [Methylocapsa sp.]